MYLKRLFLIAIMTWPLFVYANNDETLCIYTKDGCRTFFYFQNKPKIVIKDNILKITTDIETLNYPLENFAKFTFEKDEITSIESNKVLTYTIKNNIISTKGLISVFNMSGNMVSQSESGEVNLSSAPKGLYLIKSKNASFKYLKK